MIDTIPGVRNSPLSHSCHSPRKADPEVSSEEGMMDKGADLLLLGRRCLGVIKHEALRSKLTLGDNKS